ncbi:MAG: hypothetical protein NC235_11225 [Clostridiales bacterium]|nr:hypothetical protein [Alistipes senegalensis]MCM1362462.1 hypothetical protein [Clostridiales bacterium]
MEKTTKLTFRSIQRWYSDNEYRQPFLDNVEGALTKELLVCDEDVQVIHGFDSMGNTQRLILTPIYSRMTLLQDFSLLGLLTLIFATIQLLVNRLQNRKISESCIGSLNPMRLFLYDRLDYFIFDFPSNQVLFSFSSI